MARKGRNRGGQPREDAAPRENAGVKTPDAQQKRYLTDATWKSDDRMVHITFGTPFSVATPLPDETIKFIDRVIGPGGVNTADGGQETVITGFSFPKTLTREQRDTFYRLLDEAGICKKDIPNAQGSLLDLVNRQEATVAQVNQAVDPAQPIPDPAAPAPETAAPAATPAPAAAPAAPVDPAQAAAEAQAAKELQERLELGNLAGRFLAYLDIAHLIPETSPKQPTRVAGRYMRGMMEPNVLNNAKGLKALREFYGRDTVERQMQELKIRTRRVLADLVLQPESETLSDSWVYNELARLFYAFQNPGNTPSVLPNPMESARVQQEIVNRQLGRDFLGKYRRNQNFRTTTDEMLAATKNAEAAQVRTLLQSTDEQLSPENSEILGRHLRAIIQEQQNLGGVAEDLGAGETPTVEGIKAVLMQRDRLVVKDGETLELEKDDYPSNAEIVVENGGTLIIAAGTKLRFAEGKGIVCHGDLEAVGTKADPIIFTSLDKTKPWSNITIMGAGYRHLEHCKIENGRGRHYSIDAEKNVKIEEQNPEKKKNTNGGGLAIINAEDDTRISNVEMSECQTKGYRKKKGTEDHEDIVSGSGGAIWIYESSPAVIDSKFAKNKASIGGAIHVEGGAPTLDSNTYEKNSAENTGGGVSLINSTAEVVNSKFHENTATNGGGLYVSMGKLKNPVANIDTNTFGGNVAKESGGAAFIHLEFDRNTGEAYFPDVDNFTSENNKAKRGGALYLSHNISRGAYDYFGANANRYRGFRRFNIPNASGRNNSPNDVESGFRAER